MSANIAYLYAFVPFPASRLSMHHHARINQRTSYVSHRSSFFSGRKDFSLFFLSVVVAFHYHSASIVSVLRIVVLLRLRSCSCRPMNVDMSSRPTSVNAKHSYRKTIAFRGVVEPCCFTMENYSFFCQRHGMRSIVHPCVCRASDNDQCDEIPLGVARTMEKNRSCCRGKRLLIVFE